MATEDTGNQAATGEQRATGKLRIDASAVNTTYCNFFTTRDSPEEVVLNLGLTQHWDPKQKELQVKMLQQVIMHPAAARRLKDTLVQLFERRDARAARGKPRSDG